MITKKRAASRFFPSTEMPSSASFRGSCPAQKNSREKIDKLLTDCGWTIQNRNTINLSVGKGITIREARSQLSPFLFDVRRCSTAAYWLATLLVLVLFGYGHSAIRNLFAERCKSPDNQQYLGRAEQTPS